MENEYNWTTHWLIAAALSLAFHVILVSLLLYFNAGPSAPADETPKPPAIQAEPPPVQADKPATQPEKPAQREETTARDTPQPELPQLVTRADDKPVPTAKPENVSRLPSEDEPEERRQTTEYVVRRGDSLHAIAKRFSCTVTELAKLNGKSVKALEKLFVGQKLKVVQPR